MLREDLIKFMRENKDDIKKMSPESQIRLLEMWEKSEVRNESEDPTPPVNQDYLDE